MTNDSSIKDNNIEDYHQSKNLAYFDFDENYNYDDDDDDVDIFAHLIVAFTVACCHEIDEGSCNLA